MQQQFYDAMYEIERAHWWFQGKQKIVKSLLDKYLPDHPERTLRILDAGCGCGLMLEELQAYGEVEGMDFSDTAIAYCRRSFSGKLFQWDLNQPLEFERAYDCIVALDVLEHIADDHTAIRTFANGLTDDGIVIATVPANPWMWSEHDRNCMHQRRYTKGSLEMLCRSSGLTVQYLSYYNFWLFLPIACVRAIEKFSFYRPSRKKSLEYQLPPTLINRTLYRVFSSENKVISSNKEFFWGVSLIAILKK